MTPVVEVIATIKVPGRHRWDGAPPVVRYLANEHRHIFTFKVGVLVGHSDRDVEFHQLQDRVRRVLMIYPDGVGGRDFGSNSCEMLALVVGRNLADGGEYHVAFTEVWEDDENGARVTFAAGGQQ